MTNHPQQTNQAQPPSTDPGKRLMARVLAAYDAAMKPIAAQTFASEFCRILFQDKDAAAELTLRVLTEELLNNPDQGGRLGDIRLQELVLHMADALLQERGYLPPSATEPPVAEPETKGKAGKAPAAGKAGKGKAPAAKKDTEPKAKKDTAPAAKKAKAEAKADKPSAAPSSRKSGNPPPEYTKVTSDIISAVKKAGTDGLKIQSIVDAAGGQDKETVGKLVRKLVEEKKLAKRDGTQGPGTHYIAA